MLEMVQDEGLKILGVGGVRFQQESIQQPERAFSKRTATFLRTHQPDFTDASLSHEKWRILCFLPGNTVAAYTMLTWGTCFFCILSLPDPALAISRKGQLH